MVKEIKPLINKKNTLQTPKVIVNGENEFGRLPIQSQQTIQPLIKQPQSSQIQKRNEEYRRADTKIEISTQYKPKETMPDLYKSSQTAKISPDVKIRLNIIESFMDGLGGVSSSTTLSQLIDVLLNHYVDTKLNPRQREGFKGIYQQKIENYK